MQRAIRFLLASKAEESAINLATALAGNRLRDVRETFAQHSRARLLIYPLDLRTARGATSVRCQCQRIGLTIEDTPLRNEQAAYTLILQ